MVSTGDVWLTPRAVLDALGGADSFDLDPCMSEGQPWPTALAGFTWRDNGLLQAWSGRIWLNPPYSRVAPWLGRLADHGQGTALIFANMDTEAVQSCVLDQATAVLFVAGRLRFHLPDGRPAPHTAPKPSMLCAYGQHDAEILADANIEGRFVPLRLPRLIAIALPDATWSEAVAGFLRTQRGPVALADLYRAFAAHPKARSNRHYAAKIRQVLQQGAGRRVAPGQWRAA